jgi:hypothetical protein
MTTALLPRIAADLDGNGHAFYAAHALLGDPDAENIIWFPSPTIPAGLAAAYRWADDTDVTSPHATFDTIGELAELIFLSGREPLALDDAEAADAIDSALAACHCNMLACAASVAAEIADHPECAGPRFERAVVRAARLLGTEA